MAKKYRYFQPEYASKFQCDGAKCNARCCKGWDIAIDNGTFKQYSRLEGIVEHIHFDSEQKDQHIELDRRGVCPFLTENKLCSIQLKYGAEFLSQTCSTYPRHTKHLGNFFERALTFTCPVAAEMILFASEPMKFGFVEVPKEIHSNGGKIEIDELPKTFQENAEFFRCVQVAMISILQNRTLPINHRLIVLCFFIDKFEEIISNGSIKSSLKKLIEVYKSKTFWAEQVPLMIQSIQFDSDSFIRLMMQVFEAFYGANEGPPPSIIQRKSMELVINTLGIKVDENSQISISKIVANYNALANARKKFQAEYSTFLENFLVNELFLNFYPWRYANPSKSISIFLITCKVFELFLFSLTYQGFSSRNDVLMLVNWYTTYIDHNDKPKKKIFDYIQNNEDYFALMETLLEQ